MSELRATPAPNTWQASMPALGRAEDAERWRRVLEAARFTPEELSILLLQDDIRAKDAAKRCGLGRTQFWRQVQLHRIPKVQHSPRVITFRAIDIEAYKRWRLVTCAADTSRLADRRRDS